ncbi:MAG: hypothetical protein JW759_10390 [Candidatus Coatesbacteria bacterium]|nr:hypothetical protein [Candidatus Coatesbacteria bacterium]
MRRHALILLATGAISVLASLAFAGYFTSDGRVYPPSGPVYFQIFKWSVEYNLDESQPAPVGVVQVWKSGFLEFEDMMSFTVLEGVVYYW